MKNIYKIFGYTLIATLLFAGLLNNTSTIYAAQSYSGTDSQIVDILLSKGYLTSTEASFFKKNLTAFSGTSTTPVTTPTTPVTTPTTPITTPATPAPTPAPAPTAPSTFKAGPLNVTLTSTVNTGTAPLAVPLTAKASGTTAFGISYAFDCNNDGKYEASLGQVYIANPSTYTCNYPTPGNYIAKVMSYTSYDPAGKYSYLEGFASVPVTVKSIPGVLTVNLNSASPAARGVAGGTLGVVGAILDFKAANENITLNRIALNIDGSNPALARNFKIYDGTTLLGTASITSGTRTLTAFLNTPVTLIKDVTKPLTVKMDLVSTTQSGQTVGVSYDPGSSLTSGIGTSTGTTITSSTRTIQPARLITVGAIAGLRPATTLEVTVPAPIVTTPVVTTPVVTTPVQTTVQQNQTTATQEIFIPTPTPVITTPAPTVPTPTPEPTPTPAPQAPLLGINIDFGGEAGKTGAAAAGNGGDVWNAILSSTSGLKFTDGSISPVSATLNNLGGSWGLSSGVNDPMYNSFIYPSGNNTNPASVTLSGVPAGIYNLYLYENEGIANSNVNFSVNAGGTDLGTKATSPDISATTATSWSEGLQYVVYRNVQVNSGQSITINIARTNRDAAINGLQLVPVSRLTYNQNLIIQTAVALSSFFEAFAHYIFAR